MITSKMRQFLQMQNLFEIIFVVVIVGLLLPGICLQDFCIVTADTAAAVVATSPNQEYNWNFKTEALPSVFRKGNGFIPAVNEFSSHSIIQPKIHCGKNKKFIRSTLNNEDGLHVAHITLSYYHQGRYNYADLLLNKNLLPDAHFLRYQSSNTSTGYVVKNFTKTDVELCHYQGSIRGKPTSRVALSTCNGGVNGVVFDGSETYFIHSGNDGRLQDDHYLFRHSDRVKANSACGQNHAVDDNRRDAQDYNLNKNSNWNLLASGKEISSNHIDGSKLNRILRYKRSYDDNNAIRGPFNANKHSSYVELVIVVDNKVYKSFGENKKKVHNHCKDLANIINALYVPLNIFIALVGVVIWNDSNEIDFSSDGDVTLRSFLNYRRTKLVVDHPNDNAQLLTKEQFEGGVVGKALKGPICTHEYSGGVSVAHSQVSAVVATTMAHEMGHNFGMEHDSPDCKCQDEKCIMSASSTSVVPVHWSSCSIDQLNIAFSRGMNYCLRNKPTKLFDSPQCGNGFVEPGEQCDCGLPSYCENSCCDPYTCMLHANASCATGECCDLNTCRPKIAGTECRLAENECDLPEYCTGESEYCPSDVFKRDTESCDNGSAYCFQGNCRSHSNQCRILWGPTGKSSEHCYWKNTEGKRGGNCGYNRLNSTFIACRPENVACGMLHCRHFNERLEFGMESAAVLSHSFINHGGNIVACRTALVDLGLQSTDPGLTPNGAKCGEDKMCVNQECLSIAQVRAGGVGKECPQNCNGNGVCNSRRNCHCNIGFTGATCMTPGPGGSRDSGPATNPNSHDAFQRFMYIFFFAVIPFMAIFCWFMYYCRNRPFFINDKLAENIIKSAGGNVITDSKQSVHQGIHAISTPHNGSLPKSTPSSTDDINSALLKSPNDSSYPSLTNGMFGKFKGFTLRPLGETDSPVGNLTGSNVAFVQPVKKTITSDSGVPQRLPPPPPTTHTRSDGMKFHKGKLSRTLARKAPPPPNAAATVAVPALPPLNPSSQARPIISMPVLEASTCAHAVTNQLTLPLTSMCGEMAPTRPAPSVPIIPNAVKLKADASPPVPLHGDPKLNVKRDGTIRRIASFLKKEEKYPTKEKTYIDREKLKNIEISSPMPMVETSHFDSSDQLEETKNLVKRTQSMRSPTKKQTNLQTFGSMRQATGTARPKSVVNAAGARPKSPPPRPPPLEKTNLTTSSGYQLSIETTKSNTANTYDACEFNEQPPQKKYGETTFPESDESVPCVSVSTNDNIYAVIDEIPPAAQTMKRSDLVSVCSISSCSSGGDIGLLGEIVNEIEKRKRIPLTANSLSKTSLLPTPAPNEKIKSVVTLEESEGPSKVNRLSNGSNYLRATQLNAPVARVAPTRSESSSTSSFSSFKPSTILPTVKSQKPATSTTSSLTSATELQNRYETPSETTAAISKPTTLNKSTMPVDKKSLTNTASSMAATVSGTSTATTTVASAAKSLSAIGASRNDVIKPKPPTSKPSVAGSRLGRVPSTGSTTARKFGATTTSAAAPRASPVIKSKNVASLQQRFESAGRGGAESFVQK